ncbi:DUF2281 domain-containing protein [bacterium]|nr:DUF2281 domain-containing protein [bacterium]
MSPIESKINKLPQTLRKEVEDFVDSLLKQTELKKKKPKLEWFGGLKKYREKYTALELQDKATKWRD